MKELFLYFANLQRKNSPRRERLPVSSLLNTKSHRRLYGLLMLTLFIVILSMFFSAPLSRVNAQEPEPGPVYIVQEGDSLWSIAIKFNVPQDELQQINNLSNPNQLKVGDRLVIPGLEGVQGVIGTIQIPYGETLHSLSHRYQVPEDTIKKLNHLTSPTELYAGSFLILPEQENQSQAISRSLLAPAQSFLELAVTSDTNPWDYVLTNDLNSAWDSVSGEILYYSGNSSIDANVDAPAGLPEDINAIEVQPIYPLQGRIAVIKIDAQNGMSFSGSFMGHDMHFFPNGDQEYVAMQGVHAMAKPGVYPMEIEGQRVDGTSFNYSQMILVQAINYPYDRPLTVDPATIDPAVTKPEDAEWNLLAQPATPKRMWEGKFQIPVPLPLDYCLETGDCWASRFGNRRSYNGGAYKSFHTGLDIVGRVGTDILAPAPGVVVFVGPLTVRGNATMIDHGWGLYTAYMHQDEIYVNVGDVVETGQLIGRVGATGRVEGPHLHWEVWVGGVQVDPLELFEQTYP
jgi:murein DD-endopeptidase MepM/ murein hydrolase activator NlpD